MQASEVVTFHGDNALDEAMTCVRHAFNEIHPDKPITSNDDLARAALHDKLEGNLIFGVVLLKKGVWSPSYHLLPGDESRIAAKLTAGHRPMLVGAVWADNILCAETGYKLIDLDSASAIDPRIRERLKAFYAVKNG